MFAPRAAAARKVEESDAPGSLSAAKIAAPSSAWRAWPSGLECLLVSARPRVAFSGGRQAPVAGSDGARLGFSRVRRPRAQRHFFSTRALWAAANARLDEPLSSARAPVAEAPARMVARAAPPAVVRT